MRTMEKAVRSALTWLAQRAIGLLVAVLVVLAATQVVLRYGFGASLLWIEEVSVILLIWLAWIGVTYLWLTGAHIAVDLVPSMVNETARRRLAYLADALALAGGTVLFLTSLKTVSIFSGMDLGSLEINAAIKYYPVTAGSAGLAIAAALNIWSRANADEIKR